ncbi:hypothetical protein, partial [Klebsiella pneumoniae]|uniref:hypothetical protein n=1 Tax=Klebsiella pneumoniae TaxID=573 RepID=UPI003EDE94B4
MKTLFDRLWLLYLLFLIDLNCFYSLAQHSIIFLLTLIAKTSINQKRNSFFISGHQKTTQLISIRTPL